MKRCAIVCGAAGFIGSNLVRYLLNNDWNVVSVDKLTYAGLKENLAGFDSDDRHRFVHGAIEDTALLAALLREHEPGVLINLAAESHVDRSIDEPEGFMQTNVVGVFRLLESVRHYLADRVAASAQNFRFLQISTDEVYGSVSDGAFTENSLFRPSSPYAASKASGDCMVRAYYKTYGVPTVISNCSNNYGPFQFPEKLVPLTIAKALAGEPIPIYGDGRQRRDWLYVEDHCRALALLAESGKPGETYNIGGSCCIENLEIVATICNLLDRLRPRKSGKHADAIVHVQDRPGHDRHYEVNHEKITSKLGWKPQHGIEDGLEATINWYLENDDWWKRVRSRGYAGERLGLTGTHC